MVNTYIRLDNKDVNLIFDKVDIFILTLLLHISYCTKNVFGCIMDLIDRTNVSHNRVGVVERMDNKVQQYYQNGNLYKSHTFMTPQAGETLSHKCTDCKFNVEVIGQREQKKVCLSQLKVFKTGQKRLPQKLEILDFTAE